MEKVIPWGEFCKVIEPYYEEHQLPQRFFTVVNTLLEKQGLLMKGGSKVDAKSGLVHHLETTPAKTNDRVPFRVRKTLLSVA